MLAVGRASKQKSEILLGRTNMQFNKLTLDFGPLLILCTAGKYQLTVPGFMP